MTAPAGTVDPDAANNSATDTDMITVALPALGLLDNFDRANATGLGTRWSQPSVTTQDFNTLANTGTSGALPAGWFLAESGPTGSSADTTYGTGTGSNNAGNTYSFGAAASTERAFGTLLSGTLNPRIGATFTNTTGAPITSLQVGYTGEQWRFGLVGGGTRPVADRLDFSLSTDATSLTTGTWIDYNALDFTAPVTTGTVGARDGNAAANRTVISATLTGLSIPDGSTFWIRWLDFDVAGADDGLAVDDFSISPIAPVTIGVNANQALAAGGQAIWNGTTGGGPTYGGSQGAAFTFVQDAGAPAAPLAGSSLVLKATGGAADNTSQPPPGPLHGHDASWSRRRPTVAAVFTQVGTLPATLANGDTLTAVANADGSVDVWQNASVPAAGSRARPSPAAAGSGSCSRPGARVDNFSGGTLP